MPVKKNSEARIRATIICLRSRKVLMVRKKGGKWNFPGGAVETGESPAQAAVRELHEETSLASHGLLPLCSVSAGTTLHHVFTTQFDGRQKPIARNEIADCRWIALDALEHIPLTAAALALLAVQIPALVSFAP